MSLCKRVWSLSSCW